MNEQILTNRPLFPAQLDMSHPLTKGLVGCWVMNEEGGSRVWDSSPYKNHGLVTGAKGRWQGRQFNGSTNIVNCGDNPVLDITTALTLEAWVKQTTAPGAGHYFIAGRDGNTSRNFWMYSASTTGKPSVVIVIGGALKDVGGGDSTALTVGVWSHIVGTYDGTTIYFFKNGVRVGTLAQAGAIDNDDVSFTMGLRAVTLDRGFPGVIGLVRAWNRAVGAQDIQNLYTNPYDMFLK